MRIHLIPDSLSKIIRKIDLDEDLNPLTGTGFQTLPKSGFRGKNISVPHFHRGGGIWQLLNKNWAFMVEQEFISLSSIISVRFSG